MKPFIIRLKQWFSKNLMTDNWTIQNLTLRDIRIIKETLTEKFLNIYHVRIEYPEEKK